MKSHSLVFLLLYIFVSSCISKQEEDKVVYLYPSERIISDSLGVPDRPDHISYLPKQLTFMLNDSIYTERLNSDEDERWAHLILYTVEEPVLYNFYLERDIYRWICARSLHSKFVMTLNKEQNEIWIEVKVIDIANEKGSFFLMYNKEKSFKKNLSLKDWLEFDDKFRNTLPFSYIAEYHTQIDGSVWWIEVHKKDYYGLIKEQSPSGMVFDFGRHLNALSDLKEEIY